MHLLISNLFSKLVQSALANQSEGIICSANQAPDVDQPRIGQRTFSALATGCTVFPRLAAVPVCFSDWLISNFAPGVIGSVITSVLPDGNGNH